MLDKVLGKRRLAGAGIAEQPETWLFGSFSQRDTALQRLILLRGKLHAGTHAGFMVNDETRDVLSSACRSLL
jgi:hypothetical protein